MSELMNSPLRVNGSLLILNYHHVDQVPHQAPLKGMFTTPSQLEKQILCLKDQDFQFTTLNRLAGDPAENKPENKPENKIIKLVILTFDDGYRDNYENLYPLLMKHQIPAMIFLVAGSIGKENLTWSEAQDQSYKSLLTVTQIQQMARDGIEFGSHLMHHTHLDRLEDQAAYQELFESRKVLSDLLQTDITAVAYPFGAYHSRTLEITRQAGYQFGLTTQEGVNLNSDNPLTLKRCSYKGHKFYHILTFKQKIKSLKC